MQSVAEKEFFVGKEAQSNRRHLSLRYPMSHGITTNWEDMEKVNHNNY